MQRAGSIASTPKVGADSLAEFFSGASVHGPSAAPHIEDAPITPRTEREHRGRSFSCRVPGDSTTPPVPEPDLEGEVPGRNASESRI